MRKTRKFAEGGDDFNTTDYASSGSAGGTNMSFKEAFRAARKQGLDKFTWKGKSFTTELASAKKSEPAKAAEPVNKGEPSVPKIKLSELSRPSKPSVSSQTGGMRAALRAGEKSNEIPPPVPKIKLSELSRPSKPSVSSQTGGMRAALRAGEEAPMEEVVVSARRPSKTSNRKAAGGSIKKYASGGSVRGKGCEVKGTGKGRMR